MNNILDGKIVAKHYREKIKTKALELTKLYSRSPGLAVVLVGDNPASESYVKNKCLACEECSIKSFMHKFNADTKYDVIRDCLIELNNAPEIDGILLQLPLPHGINSDSLLDMILLEKDVDGFNPYNLGKLAQKRPFLRSCTPYGIMLMLEYAGVKLAGKHAVVVGASNIVGRPMALELLMANATVTICNSKTENLSYYTNSADILVAAIGRPLFIKGEMIKNNAIIIDVGINKLPNGIMVGDVDFDAAVKKASLITPVPGGVGPMTITALLSNTLTAFENRNKAQF